MSGMKNFLTKYNLTLKVKNKSNFMKAAGLMQTLFSKISYKEFMNSYTSTIGSTIYSDKGWIDRIHGEAYDTDDVALLVHETQHVLQFRDGSWKRYVTSGGRSLLEAEAIAAANQFCMAQGRPAKDRHEVINQLARYGCKLVDCIAAANYVALALTPSAMVKEAIREHNLY
jgi:hypothetical protein